MRGGGVFWGVMWRWITQGVPSVPEGACKLTRCSGCPHTCAGHCGTPWERRRVPLDRCDAPSAGLTREQRQPRAEQGFTPACEPRFRRLA